MDLLQENNLILLMYSIISVQAVEAEADRVAAERKRTDEATKKLRDAVSVMFRNHHFHVVMTKLHAACEHGII